MPIINVSVINKIATASKRNPKIVCGNEDYVVKFTFDDEWSGYNKKYARFVFNGVKRDVEFFGDECPIPKIEKSEGVEIGVWVGNIATTTAAFVECELSILCKDVKAPPPESEFVNTQNIANGAVTTPKVADKAITADKIAKDMNFAMDEETRRRVLFFDGDLMISKYFAGGTTGFRVLHKGSEGDVSYKMLSDDVKEKIEKAIALAECSNNVLGFETVSKMNEYIASKRHPDYDGIITAGSYIVASCDAEIIDTEILDWDDEGNEISTPDAEYASQAELCINGEQVYETYFYEIYPEGSYWDQKHNRYYIVHQVTEDCRASDISFTFWVYNGHGHWYFNQKNERIAVIDNAEPTVDDLSAYDIPYGTPIHIEMDDVPDYWWANKAIELEAKVPVNIDGKVIKNGTVTTDKLSNGGVTSQKIADSSVTTQKIEDKAVTTNKIADSSISHSKIQDKAVNLAKLSDDVKAYIEKAVALAEGANHAIGFETVAKMNSYIASKKKKSYTGTIRAGSYIVLSCDFRLNTVTVGEEWDEEGNCFPIDSECPVDRAIISINGEFVRDDYDWSGNEGYVGYVCIKGNRYYVVHRILEDCRASDIWWKLFNYEGYGESDIPLDNPYLAVIEKPEPTIDDILAYDIIYGTPMLIEEENVPDYWWAGSKVLEHEAKIDLAEYVKKSYVDALEARIASLEAQIASQ